MEPLAGSVVIDYQNVHLTGHERFPSTRYGPKHEALIDPLHFANQLIATRNDKQNTDRAPAFVQRVLVYRGQPSPDHDPRMYARSLAQKSRWERDERVHVTLRPLKYRYRYDERGRAITDVHGIKVPVGPPREKGVDVLCALAVVREAARGDVDLVVVASGDSDLEPALDEALDSGQAKIETFSWWQDGRHSYELRPTDRRRRVWNTRLNEQEFLRCVDRTDYN